MFKTNEGKTDRAIRIILGLTLIMLSYFVGSGFEKSLLLIAGVVSLVTGITGFCGLYSLFGINTCPVKITKVKAKNNKSN